MSEQFYAEKMLSYAEKAFGFFVSSISAIVVYLAFSKDTGFVTYAAIALAGCCVAGLFISGYGIKKSLNVLREMK